MNQPEVKFGEWIQKGFDLYKNNIGLLILASLIAIVLSVCSLTILVGPMLVGLILIILGLHDNQGSKPEIGDIFKGFNYFLPAFLFVLVWLVILLIVNLVLGFIPCIGSLVAMFLSWSIGALIMFGPFIIAEKNCDFWAASQESINTVKANFWPFLAFSVVAGLIGSIGAIACGIGVIITFPIQYCILAVAYRELFGDEEPQATIELTPEPMPGNEPPPAE